MHFLTIDDRGLILNEADIRLHVSGEYGETTGEKIEVKEVEKRIEEIEKKKVISKQQVESDLKKILERCSQEVELGSKEYKKYLNALNQLERVLW